jgi:hypothetical protein
VHGGGFGATALPVVGDVVHLGGYFKDRSVLGATVVVVINQEEVGGTVPFG